VINTIAVFTFSVLVAQLWYASSERSLVFFPGSPGSSTSAIGPRIAEQIALAASPGGGRYHIAVESTSDNVSIRERMAAENNRYALGIIEDGNGFERGDNQSDALRVLLPLEWDYLFVLCSPKLYARASLTVKEPKTLADVIAHVEAGMLYTGPEKSTTARMAGLALSKFGSVAIDKMARGIGDWREMRSALKRGELELVFAKGPLGSSLLSDVAGDESAVLLGLGPITEAIQRETGFQVYNAVLPPSLCYATSVDIAGGQPVAFCRPELTTLASRRVLACPKTLSTADAYVLANIARRVCEEDEYQINLKADDIPRGSDAPRPAELRMPIHPGLQYLRDQKAPFVLRDWNTWPTWLRSALLILAGLLVVDALHLLARYFNSSIEGTDSSVQSESAAKPKDQQSPDDYERFSALLAAYEAEVDTQAHRDTAAQLEAWAAKLRELKSSIKASSQLAAPQREQLLSGVRGVYSDIALSSQMHHKRIEF
jgi:hypothetical protein